MSVVNKMLRDLENRQHAKPLNANYIPPSKPKKRWMGLALGIGLLVSAATISVFTNNKHFDPPAKNDAPPSYEPQRGDQIAQINNAGQAPIQDIGQAPIQNTGQAPIQDIGQALIQNTGRAPIQNTGQAPIVLTKATPLMDLNYQDKTLPSFSKQNFEVKTSDGAKGELSNLRALAHLASQQGNDEEVIRLLNQILSIDEREIRTRKQLAALLFSLSKFSEAKVVLTDGLKQVPADSSLRLMLSRIHFRSGNNFDAFNVLVQHPFNQLANDELLSFRAALAEKIGEYEIAQQDYQILVQRNPLEAKWWLGLGVAQDKQRLSEEAIESYLQAQQLNQLPANVESFVEQRIQLLARRS